MHKTLYSIVFFHILRVDVSTLRAIFPYFSLNKPFKLLKSGIVSHLFLHGAVLGAKKGHFRINKSHFGNLVLVVLPGCVS